ncbi:MAG: RluA family pseudouridine synthase [Bacillales bacterium]|jgi:23S rRNA pseudouridine955/2504/2580 synthase|nr:RluA family pseudouridine synthase [Bacillales bacterium]
MNLHKKTITFAETGEKILKYMKEVFPNASLKQIYQIIRQKDVKINNKKVPADYVLKEGDIITIYHTLSESKPLKSSYVINFQVIYEDDNILVINKPIGVETIGEGNSIANQVLTYYKDNNSSFTPAPIHRLDRNTSGLLIVAKNNLTSQILSLHLKKRTGIKKNYYALVSGHAKAEETISLNLEKDLEKNKVLSKKEGQTAITKYTLIETNNKYSFLDVELLTGRTHQIRAHLALVGLAILGDAKYGDFQLNKYLDEKYHFKHQFLQAYKLSFSDLEDHLKYLNNKTITIPLNAELLKLKKELL